MERRTWTGMLATALVAISGTGALAQAPYDGIQAGLDAWRLGEDRRQSAVADQLYWNDSLKFWSGLPTSRGDVLAAYPYEFYGYGYPAFGYEYRSVGPLGRSYLGGAWALSPLRYGVGYVPPLVRQPVGRVEIQTGPNRWESHPVYDPPLSDALPSPPVDSPWLDRTPYAQPRPAPAEADLPPTSGPRPLIESAESGRGQAGHSEAPSEAPAVESAPAPGPQIDLVPPPAPRER